MTKELLTVERRTAVQLRDDGKISDEVLRRLERELDLSEARLSLSSYAEHTRNPGDGRKHL